MKARILVPDPAGRWQVGEIGDVLVNDFAEKYDYCVRLPDVVATTDTSFFTEGTELKRQFYFYSNEVELLPEDDLEMLRRTT